MHEYKILEKGKSIKEARKAIVLLHGRGADAHDIITLANEFCDDSFYIAAPQATRNSWYPYSFLAPESQNEPWLTSAVETVKRLLDEIEQAIPAENIYLMGFSQGACLALETSARFARRYAGVAAFTGGLIGENINRSKYAGDFLGTPIFIGNSDMDPHVPEWRTSESSVIMKEMGAEVVYKIYPSMPHTINTDEIKTVQNWMF